MLLEILRTVAKSISPILAKGQVHTNSDISKCPLKLNFLGQDDIEIQ